MANTQVSTQVTNIKSLSSFLNQDSIKKKFTEIIGSKANGFIASLLSVINSNGQLQSADANSVYTSALMAASLDLPINPNLGLAYIVPYNTKQADGTWKVMAQFQLGYRGFKQLAQRTGLFKYLNESDVREGEIEYYDRLTGEIVFNWNQNSQERLGKKIIGYVSYFELLNGFKSIFYMSSEEIEVHAKKYSQTYKKYNSGLWKDEFDGMARKTVTKLNLSKNAPLSIELQRATLADQAIIKEFDPSKEDEGAIIIDTDYADNPEEKKSSPKKEKSKEEIKDAKEKLGQKTMELP